jgi:hypothetical protein
MHVSLHRFVCTFLCVARDTSSKSVPVAVSPMAARSFLNKWNEGLWRSDNEKTKSENIVSLNQSTASSVPHLSLAKLS